MNIFVLDLDPVLSAKYHCNKHVSKMICESAQMLSAVHRLLGTDVGYKLTHKNHPCTKWAKESLSNYNWLRQLAIELNKEWQFRYGHTRNHKSLDVILELPIPNLPDVGITTFAQAMPDEFRNTDVVRAYRSYYKNAKKDLLQYKNRELPYWIKD